MRSRWEGRGASACTSWHGHRGRASQPGATWRRAGCNPRRRRMSLDGEDRVCLTRLAVNIIVLLGDCDSHKFKFSNIHASQPHQLPPPPTPLPPSRHRRRRRCRPVITAAGKKDCHLSRSALPAVAPAFACPATATMMASGALPAEPVVALDELVGDEARRHPLEMAVETIVEVSSHNRRVQQQTGGWQQRQARQSSSTPPPHPVQAFAGSRSLDPPTAFLAKEGHRREYVCALVGLYRSMHPYLLHETHNCASVAFVREVPEAAPAAAGAAGEGGEGEAGGPGGVPARVNSSRAASSANMERPKVAGTAARSFGGGAAAADPEQLREAVRRGSVSELLALGASRPEAGGLKLGGPWAA